MGIDAPLVTRRRPSTGARIGVLLLACSLAGIARADDDVVEATPLPGSDEPASSRAEILRMLQDVQHQYGSDAVIIEGHLLGHAIRSGSMLEAVISVPGIEEREGKRFLGFKLDTGIIYNDREIDAPRRPAKAWTEIVDASLRKFRSITVPADGIVVTVGYTHKAYTNEADLRAHLHETHGEPEAVVFYLLLSDVTDLISDRITSQALVDRSTVLVNGTSARLVLVPPTPGR